MKTICYYISDYGYGHAARSIAVIRNLLNHSAHRDGLRVIIRSSKALPFLVHSLKNDYPRQVEFKDFTNDLGYVLQEGTIHVDLEKLQLRYEEYLRSFPELIAQEILFLKDINADMVVSDISPIPFVAARHANVPSVGISNFTWYTAYQGMLDDKLLQPLFNAYSKMDYFIKLAGAKEPEWSPQGTTQTGFFCRSPNWAEVIRIRNQLDPDRNKLIIFFAVGMSISVDDLQDMSMWEDSSCIFIVSSNMKVYGENIVSIPEAYMESQNYVAASDLVITKPGWGTVAEGIQFNKPMLILERSNFQEDQNTLEALRGQRGVRLIQWEQLKRMKVSRIVVDEMESTEPCRNEGHDEPLGQIVGFLDGLMEARQTVRIRREDQV